MNIPILNIYYMLVYAWDVLDEVESLRLQADDCTQLVDLFARVLHSGTEAILRRGLDRGYVAYRETIPGIRGKLDLSASIKASTFRHARAVCEFDELTYDVLHNRILKSTIRRLLCVPDLSPVLRDELAESHYRLHQISEIEISDRVFRSLQLYRRNRQYKLLMDVCRLIHQARLTSEDAGESEFREFFRDERRMRALFERFVRRFYQREQNEFRVLRNRLEWARTDGAQDAMERLPLMRTDVQLRSPRRHILIETKFVPRMFQTHFGKDTLRSSHLYQVFAYLINLAERMGQRRSLEVILLYPVVDASCDLQYEMFGHRLRVYALNLNQPWQCIHAGLLGLLRSSVRVE